MRALSKIAPIALFVGALLLCISPAAWADRRIKPVAALPITSDPEVPNLSYRGPGFELVGEQPAEFAAQPEFRAVLSESWYRRLLRLIAAQLRGGMV